MSLKPIQQIIIATLVKLLLNTGRRFLYPFAPVISRELDVPLGAVTSIIATSQASTLLGLLSGPISDRIGYRFMMLAGIGSLSMGMLVCALLPGYWPVFIGLVLASLGKTLFDPAIQAFVGQNVPFERRGRIVGIIETSWAGSTLLGIPFLSLVIEYGGLRSSYFLLAILGALGWLALERVLPPDRSGLGGGPGKKSGYLGSFITMMKSRPVAGMLVYGFLVSLANDCIFVVYGFWFEHAFLVSVVALGFSTVAIGCAELLGETAIALFADSVGIKRSISLGVVCSVCACILLPVIGQTLLSAMIGMFFVFFAFEVSMVGSFSLITELQPQARATVMAGFYALAGIGRMLGVLLGGIFWQLGGIQFVCLASATITAIGLVFFLWGLAGWRKE